MTKRHEQLIRHMDQVDDTTNLIDYESLRQRLAWRYSPAGRRFFWKRRQTMKGAKTQLRRGLWLGFPLGLVISYVFWLIVWGW